MDWRSDPLLSGRRNKVGKVRCTSKPWISPLPLLPNEILHWISATVEKKNVNERPPMFSVSSTHTVKHLVLDSIFFLSVHKSSSMNHEVGLFKKEVSVVVKLYLALGASCSQLVVGRPTALLLEVFTTCHELFQDFEKSHFLIHLGPYFPEYFQKVWYISTNFS